MLDQNAKAVIEEMKKIRKELASLNRTLDRYIRPAMYCPNPVPEKDKEDHNDK